MTELFIQLENIDVICITERWLQHSDIDNLNIQDFYPSSHFSRKNQKHGGSVIYTKANLNNAKELTKIKHISIECHAEMCGIVFNDITIICIYRRPDGIPDMCFNCVINALKLAANKTKYLIFCGDLNIDYSKETVFKKPCLIFFSLLS